MNYDDDDDDHDDHDDHDDDDNCSYHNFALNNNYYAQVVDCVTYYSSCCMHTRVRVGVENHWWSPELEDLKQQCMKITKSELTSLDFTVNKFFMKLFRTGNIEVVKNCQVYFEFSLPSVIWAERVKIQEI